MSVFLLCYVKYMDSELGGGSKKKDTFVNERNLVCGLEKKNAILYGWEREMGRRR